MDYSQYLKNVEKGEVMKGFMRENQFLSLCGLNCGLCLMKLDGYCPGCGGGAGNQSCTVARCSLQRGVEYCFQCPEYPCQSYQNFDRYDSFITHQSRAQDFVTAQQIGITVYCAELQEKLVLLKKLLEHYNDGRRKSFYCMAVNLLALSQLQAILQQLEEEGNLRGAFVKERAAAAVDLLQKAAAEKEIVLKLRKKPKQ